MLGRILTFILTLAIGLALLKYNYAWVNMLGKNNWAEDKLGAGGTYSLWKVIAILVILFGFMVLIGSLQLYPSNRSTVQEPEQNNLSTTNSQ